MGSATPIDPKIPAQLHFHWKAWQEFNAPGLYGDIHHNSSKFLQSHSPNSAYVCTVSLRSRLSATVISGALDAPH